MSNQNPVYICCQFQLNDISSQHFLVTSSLCMQITHPVFWKLLQRLAHFSNRQLTYDTLNLWCQELKLEINVTIRKLTEELGLCKLILPQAVKTLVLDVDDLFLHDLLIKDVSQFAQVIPYSDAASHYGFDDHLVLCYRQQYDDAYFEQAIERLSPGQYIVCSGIAQKVLQIDNLFSHQSGLPSHFSNLYRLQQIATSGISLGEDNWLLFYRQLCHLQQPKLPVIEPNYCEKGYIAYCLLRFVSRILNPFAEPVMTYDSCQIFWAVNLDSHDITREVAVHSPYDPSLNTNSIKELALNA